MDVSGPLIQCPVNFARRATRSSATCFLLLEARILAEHERFSAQVDFGRVYKACSDFANAVDQMAVTC